MLFKPFAHEIVSIRPAEECWSQCHLSWSVSAKYCSSNLKIWLRTQVDRFIRIRVLKITGLFHDSTTSYDFITHTRLTEKHECYLIAKIDILNHSKICIQNDIFVDFASGVYTGKRVPSELVRLARWSIIFAANRCTQTCPGDFVVWKKLQICV